MVHVTTGRTLRGGERQLLLLLAGLRAAGDEQVLVSPTDGTLTERARAAGHAVAAIPIWNEGDARAAVRMAGVLRRFRPDVVHLHTSQAHGLGAVAARSLGRRRPGIVVTRRVEHSIFRHSFLRLDRLKYDPGADHVLCVSSRVRDVLVADGLDPDRLSVVPDGVDVDRFASSTRTREAVRAELSVPPTASVVGCVGQLEPAKGQVDLVRALPRLVAAHPDVHLVLVGEGRGEGELRGEAALLGVTARVHLPGLREDVPDLLHAMDVFAFPSRSEGLGSSVLEAMAAGLPVVAARVGGIPEAVEDGTSGRLVPPGDVEALAAVIDELISDREGAARLGESARRVARERYGSDRMVAATRAAYARVTPEAR